MTEKKPNENRPPFHGALSRSSLSPQKPGNVVSLNNSEPVKNGLYPPGSSFVFRGSVGPKATGHRMALVANRTGGQGKTLVSHFLAHLLKSDQRNVYCADKAGSSGHSKLGSALTHAIEIGAGPDPDKAALDETLLSQHWDKLGSGLMSGNSIVDLGANVIDSIAAWARLSDVHSLFKDEVACDLVIPVVASPQSLSDAVSIIELFASGTIFPLRSLTIILNAWQSEFLSIQSDPSYQFILDLEKKYSLICMVHMPRCKSRILRSMEERSLSLDKVAGKFLEDNQTWNGMSKEEVASEFDLDLFAAGRELKSFQLWYHATCESIQSCYAVSDFRNYNDLAYAPPL